MTEPNWKERAERAEGELKNTKILLAEKNVTANTFMAQVRKLQAELDRVKRQNEKMRAAILSVLCDPEGVPCFIASDEDRQVIADALWNKQVWEFLNGVITPTNIKP